MKLDAKPHAVSEFDPDAIRALKGAYEQVLAWLPEGGFADIPEAEVPRVVASLIMAEARRGELDPRRLRDATMHAMLLVPAHE